MRRLLIFFKNILSIPSRMFSKISIFAILQESKIDKNSAICSGVKFYRSSMGKYSYVGNKSFISNTIIGNFTSISADCYIGGTTHPIDWVSTSPVFHKWDNIMKKNFAYNEFDIFEETIIGNDVWIGNRVMIKAGLTIGNGAIIGMGSVVTKDVGPFEIWAGNPARLIKKRFNDEQINNLEKIKWWNRDDSQIMELSTEITNIQQFIAKEAHHI